MTDMGAPVTAGKHKAREHLHHAAAAREKAERLVTDYLADLRAQAADVTAPEPEVKG
jgi:hypothetical protein